MNKRLELEYSSGRVTTIWHTCKGCFNGYPKDKVCWYCAPEDPMQPRVGMPIVDVYGVKGIVLDVYPESFIVQADPGQTKHGSPVRVIPIEVPSAAWLRGIHPDFTRSFTWEGSVKVNAYPPRMCAKCNKNNDYDNLPNKGSDWWCAECLIINSML